jgi:hypothetical protein
MRRFPALSIGVFTIALCLCAQGQNTPGKAAQISESKGMPPRAAPTDYQAHAQAGAVTIAAEFMGHAVPTPEATFSTEDYVIVEAAFFGPPEARTTLSFEDFSLRINDKKAPLSSQPYALVFHSLKDPEWAPPESAESKSKTSFGTGGKGDSGTPPPAHMPIELQRAMEQKVQRASLLGGDRALPQAGLIFFQYRGKTEKIRSIELIYAGPAGNATLTLQP